MASYVDGEVTINKPSVIKGYYGDSDDYQTVQIPIVKVAEDTNLTTEEKTKIRNAAKPIKGTNESIVQSDNGTIFLVTVAGIIGAGLITCVWGGAVQKKRGQIENIKKSYIKDF